MKINSFDYLEFSVKINISKKDLREKKGGKVLKWDAYVVLKVIHLETDGQTHNAAERITHGRKPPHPSHCQRWEIQLHFLV